MVLWCCLSYESGIGGSDGVFLKQNQSGPEKLAEQQMQPAVLVFHSFTWLC